MPLRALRVRRVTVALAAVACVVGRSALAGDTGIQRAPAFDAKQLTTLPTADWITNGGTLFNQRYSPLKSLNKDNVSGLKALWRSGMGSALEPG
ncbi:MAG TPA: hypothetical protein VNY82_03615, partial [Steroidobacteraceae bacterium]|nr:hypothetical protein [Steroidobacteraceae bacterium]